MQTGTRILTNGAATPDRGITAGSDSRSSRDGGNVGMDTLRSPPQYFGLTDNRLPFAPGPRLPGCWIVGGALRKHAPPSTAQRSAAFGCERVGNQAAPSERPGRTPARAIQSGWRALGSVVGDAAAGNLNCPAVLHEASGRASDSGHANQSGSVTGSDRKDTANRGLVVPVEVSDELSSFAKETGNDCDLHAPLPKKPPAPVKGPAQSREETSKTVGITPPTQGDRRTGNGDERRPAMRLHDGPRWADHAARTVVRMAAQVCCLPGTQSPPLWEGAAECRGHDHSRTTRRAGRGGSSATHRVTPGVLFMPGNAPRLYRRRGDDRR